MHKVMTYGEMPTLKEFSEAFARNCPNDYFQFHNDKRCGFSRLTESELWSELTKASQEYSGLLESDGSQDPEKVGSWLSDVLACLGFEWV